MREMGCDEVQAEAAEFAFGLGDGTTRAEMVAHLDTCPSCRRDVEQLTTTADAMLIDGPSAEPPTGFEQRVADAIAAARIPSVAVVSSRRSPRWMLVAAAAVALVVFGTGVGIGRLGSSERRGEEMRSAAMVTSDGRRVGTVAIGTEPDTVFVAVPGWRPHAGADYREPYHLRLVLRDGRSQVVGPFRLDKGDGSWGTVLAVDGQDVRRVALVGEGGTEYCAGSLG